MNYTELQVTTNFSFLRGTSHPEEMVQQSVALGYREIAITDRNSFAGIVRAHTEAKKQGTRIIPGCYLHILDGSDLLVYPMNLNGYSSICELLSAGNLRAEKGDCNIFREDVYHFLQDIKLVIVPPSSLNRDLEFDLEFIECVAEYKEKFGDHLYLAANRSYLGTDNKLLFRLATVVGSV